MISQLVVHLLKEAPPELLVVANPQYADPISFERGEQRRYIPRFGTQDLLTLAHYAMRHGWEVDRLEIQDAITTHQIESDQEDSISREIVESLSAQDLAETIRGFVRNFPALSVVGVEFVRSEDDRAVTVRRNGVVDAEDGVSALDVLEPAWRQLEIA